MNWIALIDETSRRAGVTPAEAAQTLDSFFDTVIRHMETDSVVCLREDFGCFEMRPASIKCGDQVAGPKLRKTPVFKKSCQLKRQLRQNDSAFLQLLWEAGHTKPADHLHCRPKRG